MRDRQRSKCYTFEQTHIDPLWDKPEVTYCYGSSIRGASVKTTTTVLTLAECALIAQVAYAHAGFDPVRLKVKDGRRTRIARGGPYYLNLPKGARSFPVVMHEAAHGIAHLLYSRSAGPGVPSKAIEPHGAEYVRTYLYLLSALSDDKVTEAGLVLKAKEDGLRVAPRAEFMKRLRHQQRMCRAS